MTTDNIDGRPSGDAAEKPAQKSTSEQWADVKKQWNSWSPTRRKWTIIGTVAAVFLLVGMCSAPENFKKDTESAAAVETSVEAAPAPEAEPAPEPEPAEPVIPKPPHDATATVLGDGSVDITFDIGDNFTHNMIVSGAQGDTVDLLQWAKENYPAAPEVVITGRFPMVDEFGNTATDEILVVAYTRATLDKINFEGVNRENIWKLADRRYVHPELQKN